MYNNTRFLESAWKRADYFDFSMLTGKTENIVEVLYSC